MASRARIVAAADQARRRIERDLHDGAQQRLVSLALRLRGAAAVIPPELDEVHRELADVGAELDEVLGDLRELSRGIHPAILTEGGLVRLDVRDDGAGGADPARGSGLVGLRDRVEATGGSLHVESRPGQGTRLLAELPIQASSRPTGADLLRG
jgi:signal transduction histidine kinase